MQILPGYENPTNKEKVCRLNRAMYRLKQFPRAWFGKFTKILKMLEYRQCNGDHTMFFHHSSARGITILIVYVDDIIITENNTAEAKHLEDHMLKHFEVKKPWTYKIFFGYRNW